ncbi:MAG: MFS transporter [Alphaproteobacteria bacterium]|nr:MFS transporter [Alphaproteobacteria bacterium]
MSQTPADGSKRNRAYLLWSGISESVSDILASPGMVLPFLYLALGAPQYIATLLLPCVKAARLIVEALISPYVKVGARAKYAMLLPNLIIAGVLAVVALSAESLPIWLAAALFIAVSIILGLCNGIWALGSNQIYGSELGEKDRGEIVFTQLAGSCVLAIVAVWITRDFMAGDTPYERHRVLLWMGVVALLIACVCLYQVVVTKSPQAEETDEPSSAESASFVGQVVRGWALAVQIAWFRRFLVSRIFFLSVELAMPFYTIHAATYHMSTPHILSIFVTATSAGTAIGAMVWRKLVSHSIRYTIAGASIIASFSALIAIAFDLFGLASNPWVYTTTIFFLSFGIGGVQNGRYLYLLSMSSEKDRPYMVALGDVVAGVGGIIFAAVLGLLAQLQSVLLSLLVLAALNAVAAYLALSMEEKTEPKSN